MDVLAKDEVTVTNVDDGEAGEQGPKGDTGDTGPKGDKGDTGDTGPKGDTGDQGPKGDTGDKGDKGDKGDTGDTGSTGRGISATQIKYAVSESGTSAPLSGWQDTVPATSEGEFLWTWTRLTYTSGSPAYSDFYTVAAHGATGEQGEKGDTGDQGPKGDTGDTGPQGEKGDTGDTGPQGHTGATGAQGPKGDTGSQGPQGEKGDTGDTGPQGPTGATGPQGAQGEKGDKGDTGDTGPKGDTGATGRGVVSICEQWAKGTVSAALSSSWSQTPPTLDTGYPYLWYRQEIVWSNPTETTYAPSSAGTKSTVVNELVTFRNIIANSGYTTINGSKIGAGTITLGGSANGDGLLEVYDESNNLVAKLSKSENIFAGFKVKAGQGILGFGDTGDLQQSYWSLNHDVYAFTYYFEQVPSIQFAKYTYGNEKFFDSFDGWYMSNNKNYANTAAIDEIELNLSEDTHIYMDVVDYSNEGRYDYGTVGTVDGDALDESSTYSSTGTNVKWTGYGNHSSSGETIDFGVVEAGSHTIWIRYKKDSSTDNENDRLYFRLYAGKEDALYYEDDNGSLMYLSKTRLYQRKIEATYDDPDDPSNVSYACYKTLIRNACTEVESSESDYVAISTDEIPLSKAIAQTYLYGGSIDFVADDMSTPLTYDGEEDTISIGSKLAIEGHTEPIGTIKTIVGGTDYTTDVSTAADTGKTIATLPILEAGTWLIVARVRFDPTSSGSHTSYITISSTAASTGSMDGRYGTSSNNNQHNLSVIVSPAEDTRYYLSGHAGVAGKWLRGTSAELRVVMLRIV